MEATFHNVTSVSVAHVESNGTKWINIRMQEDEGTKHEIYIFANSGKWPTWQFCADDVQDD